MNFDHLREKLEKNGFAVSVFATGEEAAAWKREPPRAAEGKPGFKEAFLTVMKQKGRR